MLSPSLNFDQRISYRSAQDAGIAYINKLLSSAVRKDRFLDLESSICQDDQCPLFDMNGKLISYDGSHLTPAGAKYVAEKITTLPFLNSLMNQ